MTVLSGIAPVGKSYVLSSDLLTIGGADEDVDFSSDPSIAPKHASIVRRSGAFFLKDEGATNGVYIRVNGPQEVPLPAIVRVGAQLIHIQEANDDQPYKWRDGTRFLASPPRKGSFVVQQIFEGGLAGASALVNGNVITIGGKGAQLDLGHDPSISSAHARVTGTESGVTIEDLGSTNGTYVRVRGEVELKHGDLIWVGTQLLRIDVT